MAAAHLCHGSPQRTGVTVAQPIRGSSSSPEPAVWPRPDLSTPCAHCPSLRLPPTPRRPHASAIFTDCPGRLECGLPLSSWKSPDSSQSPKPSGDQQAELKSPSRVVLSRPTHTLAVSPAAKLAHSLSPLPGSGCRWGPCHLNHEAKCNSKSCR